MTLVVGDQIQALPGTWTTPPTGFTYVWQRSPDGTTGWANTTDQTGTGTRSDFVVASADTGYFLSVLVTATNVAGSSTAERSAAVGPIGAALNVTGYWGIPMLISQVFDLPPVVTINTTDCDT